MNDPYGGHPRYDHSPSAPLRGSSVRAGGDPMLRLMRLNYRLRDTR